MTDRSTLMTAFLATTPWAQATRKPLAGDASNRRYERLHMDGRTAVLMDAPPSKGEDVRPFVTIAEHLRQAGLNPPDILAQDTDNGFLLLEDLGDALFAQVLEATPNQEPALYAAATEVLVALHNTPLPRDLPAYDADTMGPLAALSAVWYEPDPTAESAIAAEIKRLANIHFNDTPVLVQRDYHSENLLWLPDRKGHHRVGLLDFQDAMAGPRAYDLVSLLQDARRDVAPTTEAEMIALYCTQTGADPDDFAAQYALCGAQRNLRILGVFARLWVRDGKAHYIALIPRVWDLLQRDLKHPILSDLRDIVTTHLPAPTSDVLAQIKARR